MPLHPRCIWLLCGRKTEVSLCRYCILAAIVAIGSYEIVSLVTGKERHLVARVGCRLQVADDQLSLRIPRTNLVKRGGRFFTAMAPNICNALPLYIKSASRLVLQGQAENPFLL